MSWINPCRLDNKFNCSTLNSTLSRKIRYLPLNLGPVSPGNLGLESDFDIKVSRKVGSVLTSDEVHFVSLADNFTVQFSNLLELPLEWKTKQLNGPCNYRELRETGPWLIILYTEGGGGGSVRNGQNVLYADVKVWTCAEPNNIRFYASSFDWLMESLVTPRSYLDMGEPI